MASCRQFGCRLACRGAVCALSGTGCRLSNDHHEQSGTAVQARIEHQGALSCIVPGWHTWFSSIYPNWYDNVVQIPNCLVVFFDALTNSSCDSFDRNHRGWLRSGCSDLMVRHQCRRRRNGQYRFEEHHCHMACPGRLGNFFGSTWFCSSFSCWGWDRGRGEVRSLSSSACLGVFETC